MRSKRGREEFKIEAVKQITKGGHRSNRGGQIWVFHSLVCAHKRYSLSIRDSELQGSRNSSSERGMKRSSVGRDILKRPR